MSEQYDEYDYEGLPGSHIDNIPDLQVLVSYFWNEDVEEWEVSLTSDGLNPGEEDEQAAEMLINAVSMLRSGDLSLTVDQ